MFINNLNPSIVEFGPLTIRWYGLLFTLGIILCLLVVRKLVLKNKLSLDTFYSLAVYLVLGAIVGARLGYVLFYNLSYYLNNPLAILEIYRGGLSSHGGLLGIIIASLIFYFFKKRKNRDFKFYKYADLIIIGLPLVIVCIRLGNFINSEIVGRVTDLPWGVIFNNHGGSLARHPVQLYEALAALIIFGLLFIFYKIIKNKKPYLMTFIFIFIYFGSRFLIEFTKEYQVTTGLLTMGQWLSILPIIISLIYFSFYFFTKNIKSK